MGTMSSLQGKQLIYLFIIILFFNDHGIFSYSSKDKFSLEPMESDDATILDFVEFW